MTGLAALMIAVSVIPSVAAGVTETPPVAPSYSVVESGWAYHYRPGLMAQVARNRHMRLDPYADAYVSTPRCADIGKSVYFRLRGSRIMRGQIIDCTNPIHRAGQDQNALRASRIWSKLHGEWVRPKIVLEVNYAVARNHGQLLRDGKTPVTILRRAN